MMHAPSDEPRPMIASASHLLKLFLAGMFLTALVMGMLSPALTQLLSRLLAALEAPAAVATVSSGVEIAGSLAGGALATWVYGRRRTR